MKRIFVIGVGAGDPDHLTIQAVNALQRTDVVLLLEKGPHKRQLIDLRKEICRRHMSGRAYRFVEAESPQWRRDAPDYDAVVAELNRDKQAVFEQLICQGMNDGETGAILVWGDPTLYDSTIRNLDVLIASERLELEYEVIPGISSAQALAARHKTTLNAIGRAVHITTGRRLEQGFPQDADSVVVMLDARNAYKNFVDRRMHIYWGAYLGTPDEILISGELREVADEIERVRAQARRAHGWIMDIYLMRARDEGQR